MHNFELRFHDKLNVVILTRRYLAADDLAALGEAVRLSATHAIEVWEGARKVARIKKGNAALASTDKLAG